MKTTKQLRAGLQQLVVLAFLLGLGSQCTQQPIEKKADGPCRLKQIDIRGNTNVGGPAWDEVADQTTYDYDTAGRVSHIVRQLDQRHSNALGIFYLYITDSRCTYNADGFLTARTVKTQWASDTQKGERTEQTAYTYSAGLLAQESYQKAESSGLETKATTDYTYDSAGMLSRKVCQTTYPVIPPSLPQPPSEPNGFTCIWTYQDGKLIDFLTRHDGLETRPYVYQNGLMQSYSYGNGTYVSKYEYDNQGRRVRQEFFIEGRSSGFTELVLIDAKLPQQPPFKGFPVIIDPNGKVGHWTAIINHVADGKGSFTQKQAARMHYDLTASGNIRSADGLNGSYGTTTTYTYDGFCD